MEKLLTRKEATEFLGLSEHTLRDLASKKKNALPYIKVKYGIVMYRLSDLEAYKEKHTISEKLLTRKEATEFLGLNEHTLRGLASKKNKDLPYIKVKGNKARYRLSDLEAFKEKLTISEKLLTRKEAAEFLGVAERTLALIAWNKDLPFIRVKKGNKAMYRLSDLEAFKEKRTISGKSLTRKEAAEFLGVAEGTLVYIALPYIKVNGVAMYRLSDLEAYKEKHKP